MDSDRIEGKTKETEGEIQQKWGEAKDKARDTWDDAKNKAEDMKDDRDREGEPASRVLVEAERAGRRPLVIEPPLVLHGDGARYTPEVQRLLE